VTIRYSQVKKLDPPLKLSRLRCTRKNASWTTSRASFSSRTSDSATAKARRWCLSTSLRNASRSPFCARSTNRRSRSASSRRAVRLDAAASALFSPLTLGSGARRWDTVGAALADGAAPRPADRMAGIGGREGARGITKLEYAPERSGIPGHRGGHAAGAAGVKSASAPAPFRGSLRKPERLGLGWLRLLARQLLQIDEAGLDVEDTRPALDPQRDRLADARQADVPSELFRTRDLLPFVADDDVVGPQARL